MFTPGHTPGSMCYHFGNFLFSGDTLLCNAIGTCTHEESKKLGLTSSEDQLKESIKTKLFVLPKQTMVLPGHGPFTSIGTEALLNPSVGQKATNSFVCCLNPDDRFTHPKRPVTSQVKKYASKRRLKNRNSKNTE